MYRAKFFMPGAARLAARLRKVVFAPSNSRWRACLYGFLAAAPIVFVSIQVAAWVRNIPNWDEFDVVLDFLIALDSGTSAPEFVRLLFRMANEHRMVVSRLIYALMYGMTGGVNFIALAVAGDLFLLGTFAVLLAMVSETAQRLRLAAIFALVVFQLQHHESLFSSCASIDHFFVLLPSIAALGVLTLRSRWSLPLGCGLGFLATFSLAHGLLVWPIGAGLLWAERRRRDLAAWSMAGGAILALFFWGFSFNEGHRLPVWTDSRKILDYGLTLVGSSPALGNKTIAPWLGLILVISTAVVLWRGCQARARLAVAAIVWCLGSMAMIAWGRGAMSNDWAPVQSRYMILSSIAWALAIWLVVERGVARGGLAGRWVAPVMALLVVFNVAASVTNMYAGRVFARDRMEAVICFRQQGTFENAEMPIYPDPVRADALVREAEARGIFRLPEKAGLELPAPAAVAVDRLREIDDALYFIDEVEGDATKVRVRGWAFQPDDTTRPGVISVIFRSTEAMFAFEAMPRLRPDVAAEYRRSDLAYSGFELTLRRERLPAGLYNVGIRFGGKDAAYMMTAHTVVIQKPGPLANLNQIAFPVLGRKN